MNTSTGLGTQLVSTDVSDDGDDTDGNTTNDPTNVYTGIPPSMEAVKTYSLSDTDASGGNTPGDIITFTITLENTGQDILNDISSSRDLTLIATGSEVEIAMASADILNAEGLKVAVVTLPCWELFEQQDEKYKSEVLGLSLIHI